MSVSFGFFCSNCFYAPLKRSSHATRIACRTRKQASITARPLTQYRWVISKTPIFFFFIQNHPVLLFIIYFIRFLCIPFSNILICIREEWKLITIMVKIKEECLGYFHTRAIECLFLLISDYSQQLLYPAIVYIWLNDKNL